MENVSDLSDLYKKAAKILLDARTYITDETDVAWTSYDRPSELHKEIDASIDLLHRRDFTGVERGSFLFAPTASLQEHAISNGWTREYVDLSAAFDQVRESIKSCSFKH
jgi:hypothetical protein